MQGEAEKSNVVRSELSQLRQEKIKILSLFFEERN